MRNRILSALALSLLIAGAAAAQEFGRTSGGEIEGITKQPSRLSGSLGFTMSTFKGYEATLGGTLIKDHLWFFGTALQQNGSSMQMPVLQERDLDRAGMAKATAQPGTSQTLDASVFADRTRFLTMHYTGIISSNMFMTATISQSKTRY